MIKKYNGSFFNTTHHSSKWDRAASASDKIRPFNAYATKNLRKSTVGFSFSQHRFVTPLTFLPLVHSILIITEGSQYPLALHHNVRLCQGPGPVAAGPVVLENSGEETAPHRFVTPLAYLPATCSLHCLNICS